MRKTIEPQLRLDQADIEGAVFECVIFPIVHSSYVFESLVATVYAPAGMGYEFTVRKLRALPTPYDRVVEFFSVVFAHAFVIPLSDLYPGPGHPAPVWFTSRR